MKKTIYNIKTMAALLLMGTAVMTSCGDDEDIVLNGSPIETPQTAKTYTMTVVASKGEEALTKALSLDTEDGKTYLNATWATTENVYVKKGSDWATGSLQPQEAGTETTLTGTLSGSITISADDELTLQFPKSGTISYSGQLGTLADIEANFDYATATVEVESISATGNIIPKAATTTFTNQQAIIKFTLKDADGNALASNPSAFTISDGTSTVELTSIPDATYDTNGAGVLYVAFPATGSSATISLTATVGSDTYTYEKSGVTFTNGQYYTITVKMTQAAAGYTLISAATTSDYGKVVCAAGHLHDAKTAVPDGCTAVGILGKVTETGHGLILALQDAKQQDWGISEWTDMSSTYSSAASALCLLPDDAARGSLTSYTALGETAVSNWCVAQKSDYEAIFTNLGSTAGNSNGKTYDGNVNAYITTGVGGTAMSGGYWSATESYGLYAWAFNGEYWYDSYIMGFNNVRPVLAF